MTRAALRWLERLMLLAAAMCLAIGYVAWKHVVFASVHARASLQQMVAANAGPPLPDGEAPKPVPASGVPIGVLDIPAVDLSVTVLEGDDTRVLAFGAGHVRGTPLPWQGGNSALAGHRDTVFRALQGVRPGDRLVLATSHGTYEYEVTGLRVVEPQDVWVLDAPDVNLTLITCYPFGYVGSAPRRFIVQARRAAPAPDSALAGS